MTKESAFRLRRRQLIPNIEDAERQGMIPFPYVMLLPQPGYASPTANADENGFRVSLKAGRKVKLDRLKTASVTKGIILGNGVAWGTGTSGDRHVVHNALNDTRADDIWYSVALRATNLTQERIAAELFAPLDVTHAVWLSGVRFLDMSLYKIPHDPVMPFPGEDRFTAALGGPATPTADFSMAARWSELHALFAREMTLFSRAFRPPARSIVFALLPGLTWCDKPRSPEEQEMSDLATTEPNPAAIDPAAFRNYVELFAAAAAKICAQHGVAFIDVAVQPEFNTSAWLFADGGHLTDAGHAALAQVVSRHLS